MYLSMCMYIYIYLCFICMSCLYHNIVERPKCELCAPGSRLGIGTLLRWIYPSHRWSSSGTFTNGAGYSRCRRCPPGTMLALDFLRRVNPRQGPPSTCNCPCDSVQAASPRSSGLPSISTYMLHEFTHMHSMTWGSFAGPPKKKPEACPWSSGAESARVVQLPTTLGQALPATAKE